MSRTPGPWTVDKEWPWCVRAPGKPGFLGPILVNLGASKEVEADARLISEAPAMLELLREMEWAGEDDCPVCGNWRGSRAKGGPHDKDCKLAALLKRIEGP